MTGGFGFPSIKMTTDQLSRYRKQNVTTIWSGNIPVLAIWRPVISARDRPRKFATKGAAWGQPSGASILDFADAIEQFGRETIRKRYGNLFDMYNHITGEDPYQTPMRIYPAPHYSMGGLWVDYNLMSNLPGLFVIGEANFSDHGANRLARVH